MEREKVLSVIRSRIQEVKGTTATLKEMDFIDYRGAGLNSVDLLTIIVFLEEYFNFETDDEELTLEQLILLKDLVDMVERYVH